MCTSLESKLILKTQKTTKSILSYKETSLGLGQTDCSGKIIRLTTTDIRVVPLDLCINITFSLLTIFTQEQTPTLNKYHQ